MTKRIAGSVGLVLALVALVRADGGPSTADYTVNPDDRAELERGEWRIVGLCLRGKELPTASLERSDMRLVFKGNTLIQKGVGTINQKGFGGKAVNRESTFKLNPNSKPKEIDWALSPKMPNLGIYELDNNTLKIAIGRVERPKDFSPEAAYSIYVLKRVKP